MPPAGFEPAIPAGERPQTDALDRRPLGPAVRLIIMKYITVMEDLILAS